MRDLIARLQAAEWASRQLDAAISDALGWVLVCDNAGRPQHWREPDGTRHSALPEWTRSLDAALTLVPEGARWVLYSDGYAYVGPDDEPTAKWCGNTPALALCIAALRARMAQQEARNA